MNLTAAYIHTQLIPYCATANNIFVGYSGGIDSHVLLHLLSRVPELKSKIIAVYIHHGLQAEADAWAIHGQKTAQVLAVKFQIIHVNAQAKSGESPEAAARNARYQAFKKILSDNDLLLFAQHRDDQLETVLLQLFRGAGLKGLSGMPVMINFALGQLIRPLLDISRQQIECYAQQNTLQWIEDPSNQDRQFDRNYLRHEIIPLLEQRWPSLDKTVARTAQHCADAQALLSTSAKQKMQLLFDTEKQCLAITALLEHDQLTQQSIIREWLDYLGARMPTQKVLAAIMQDILLARIDANPVVVHDGYSVHRYRDELHLVPVGNKPDLNQVLVWDSQHEFLDLPDNGVLQIKTAQQGIARHIWRQGVIQIKYRQGGEKMTLPKRSGQHSLKKLYQEAGIAPWQRDVLPLIYIDGKLAAIANTWVSAEFYRHNETCIQLIWQRNTDAYLS
ncbi:MAG: tRNA lysidine(34) synthetase TilS [Gammaproteobacteria bacterium]|nr:MAG: tRNA lysidine(34) synthetase TilS [Gammaproteobacteria bacterium]